MLVCAAALRAAFWGTNYHLEGGLLVGGQSMA